MIFVIFSYNRGAFLDNCIRSVEACFSEPSIIIFDDNSNDPATLEVLKEYESKHTVLKPGVSSGQESKHGGLYSNMQEIVNLDLKDELACFLQDDVQVVRALGIQDLQYIDSIFAADPQTAFLSPTFLKGIRRDREIRTMQHQTSHSAYFRINSKQSVGTYYSDIAIANLPRLRAINWQFGNRENQNEETAKKHFSAMPYMENPFVMWLPNVPAYRGKVKTLAIKIAEKKFNCKLYPFNILTLKENIAFLKRNKSSLPIAEDFLSIRGIQSDKGPWRYHPLQGTFFLKQLNSLELKVKKVIENRKNKSI